MRVWILSDAGRQVAGDYYSIRFCRRFPSIEACQCHCIVQREVSAATVYLGLHI
jgi:hypothetical protein